MIFVLSTVSDRRLVVLEHVVIDLVEAIGTLHSSCSLPQSFSSVRMGQLNFAHPDTPQRAIQMQVLENVHVVRQPRRVAWISKGQCTPTRVHAELPAPLVWSSMDR